MISKKHLSLVFLLFSLNITLKAQSTSVFDANYFNKDNSAPPIKIGKGFHINDIYKQTRSCFTVPTCNPNKLTSQQIGGNKTSVKIYYTKTNEEFNNFKTRGTTGKISFLNLFTLSGQKLEEYSNKVIHQEERFIFSANVDFGIFTFETEPTLLPEAKLLIDQNKLQDFVKMFGTHYISGIRKESSINVIFTKSSSKNNNDQKSNSSVAGNGNIPFKANGSFEIENGSWTEKQFNENNYSISIEVHGPSIEQGVLQNQINEVLNGNQQNKSLAIVDLIGNSIKNISNPNQSIITQYYYSPFSLYGLDGINWDEKKQNELIKINENVVKVYSAKTKIEEVISPSGKTQIEQELRNNKVPEEYIRQITNKYNSMIPKLEICKDTADNYLKELENMYLNCSNINCVPNLECCKTDNYIKKISSYNLESKINEELLGVLEVAKNVEHKLNMPECEKRKQGVIKIKNFSTNPYHIYSGNKFIETIQGKATLTYYVNNGVYNFKAVQQSGFMLYPTENIRSANIRKVCEEITLNIGFED